MHIKEVKTNDFDSFDSYLACIPFYILYNMGEFIMKQNLIPKDLSKRADHIEISAKGGRSRSPSKVLASRINGLMTSRKLSKEQKYMLSLLKERKFVDLIIELISMSIEDIENPKRRDKIIDQLTKFLPNKNINLDISPEQEPEKTLEEEFEEFLKISREYKPKEKKSS